VLQYEFAAAVLGDLAAERVEVTDDERPIREAYRHPSDSGVALVV
jgi:hypothetical protein